MKTVICLMLTVMYVCAVPIVSAFDDKLPRDCYMSLIPVPTVNKVVDASSKGFDRRYKTGKRLPLLIKRWSGHQAMDKVKLKRTIRAVLQRLPHVRSTPRLTALVYETMAVESDLGLNGHVSVGRQYGSIQMLGSTALDILAKTRVNHPDVYSALMSFKTPKLSTRDDLKVNIPFQIAMCATYYWLRTGGNIPSIGTIKARGELWKRVYNTCEGAGTVSAFVASAKKYS